MMDQMTERDTGKTIQERLGQLRGNRADAGESQQWNNLVPDGSALTIGIPCNSGQVKTEFMSSFINMIAGNACVKHLQWADSGPIHLQRNTLAMAAMERGTSHLLMLDSDMEMPFNLIPALMRHRKPVVGALCFKRWPAYTPTLYRGKKHQLEVMTKWPRGLVEVVGTGCAAMLVDVTVFATLEYPWFRYEEDPGGKLIGEDLGFCYRCGEAGIPIYVDTTISCGHIGSMNFNEAFFKYAQLVHTVPPDALDKFLSENLPDTVEMKGG